MADLIEETDGLISDPQTALGELIASGVIENLDANGRRKTSIVDYRKKGRLRRIG